MDINICITFKNYNYDTDSVKLDSGVLVFCDSADPDALGTLQQYVTAKGWILAFTYVPL